MPQDQSEGWFSISLNLDFFTSRISCFAMRQSWEFGAAIFLCFLVLFVNEFGVIRIVKMGSGLLWIEGPKEPFLASLPDFREAVLLRPLSQK